MKARVVGTAVGIALSVGTLSLAAVAVSPIQSPVQSPVQSPSPTASPTPTPFYTPGPASPLPLPVLSPFDTAVGGEALGNSGGPDLRAAGTAKLPRFDMRAFLVADAETGDILAARNPHVPLAPASTLKTLTAVTWLAELDPRATYVATNADVSVEGSRVGLVDGGTYSVRQLWLGLLLPSGNDAAHALGEVAGGQDTAVTAMAGKAHELGAFDTVPRNTSGLDAPGQTSSAYDLALIALAGLDQPDFRAYVAKETAMFPDGFDEKKGQRNPDGKNPGSFQIQNQNRLLGGGYDGASGIKTGYTTNAGRTFVGSASRDGRQLVVVLMGYREPSTLAAATELLDWGFAVPEAAEPIGHLVTADEVAQALAAQRTSSGATAGPAPSVNSTPAQANPPTQTQPPTATSTDSIDASAAGSRTGDAVANETLAVAALVCAAVATGAGVAALEARRRRRLTAAAAPGQAAGRQE